MVEATKFLMKITPYVRHYTPTLFGGERSMFHMRQITMFMSAVRNRRRVTLEVWYFAGDQRSDYSMDFNSFTEAWRFLVKNYDTLQGGGFDLVYTNNGTLVFDSLWSLSLPNPQSESEGPLNDFLVNELITCATGVPQLCQPLLT